MTAVTTGSRPPVCVTPRPLAELRSALCRLGVGSEMVLPNGEVQRFGQGPAAFRILLRNELPLAVPLSDFSLARAYVNGDIDVDGDLMSLLGLRELLHFDIPVSQILRLGPTFSSRRRSRTPRRSTFTIPSGTTSI